ncbi:MipA/OmpV family protein [Aquabacterium sp.]|uniref:MipA/OmpV family protein n=1 Tax=Aquabacterium sp. TaxID=1872578 RepID=UPI0035B27C0E
MTSLKRISSVAVCLLAAVTAQAFEGDGDNERDLPLWEWGAGGGVLWGPAYLGSSVTRVHAAPLPYGVYRGDRLKANREGVGLALINDGSLRLDLSLNGALPVRSSGTAREGMRDLPPVVELGPVLKLRFISDGPRYWAFHWPVRYAAGLERGAEHVGWISDPTLRIIEPVRLWGLPLDFGLDVSAKFQSGDFNNYYYGVTRADARPARPVYRASGGYSGVTVNTGLLWRGEQMVVGTFVGATDLRGARFEASPLVEQRHNVFGGLAVFWVLQKSETMAPRRPVNVLSR